MENINIQEIINSLTTIPKRNYWLVRTMGGQYYEDFIENNYIAIGYDEITLQDIQSANTNNETGKSILTEIIKRKYIDENRPKYISTQLIDFAHGIKKGDVILIPSYSSDYISIGEVKENLVYIQKPDAIEDSKKCPFEKRREINWVKKDLSLHKLDSKLLHLKYTRRTITWIEEETASIIDRMITPLFIKDDDAHLSLNIQKQDTPNVVELFGTWLDLFDLIEEIGLENNVKIDKKEFNVRISVQSPGTIEFISYSVVGIVLLSLLVGSLIGAEIELKTGLIKFHIKTEGLIKKVTDFLNNKKDRKFREELLKKVKDMEIRPEDVVKILEQLNK